MFFFIGPICPIAIQEREARGRRAARAAARGGRGRRPAPYPVHVIVNLNFGHDYAPRQVPEDNEEGNIFVIV